MFLLPFFYCTAQEYPNDAEKAKICTSDIDDFWDAYDKVIVDTISNVFEDYLNNGTIGLKDFIPGQIESAIELKKLILSEKDYYSKIRSIT